MGNGMCIGTDVLADEATAFSICEDWELYAQLTERASHEGRLTRACTRRGSLAEPERLAATPLGGWKAELLGSLARPLLTSKKINFHQNWTSWRSCFRSGRQFSRWVAVLIAIALLWIVPPRPAQHRLGCSIVRLGCIPPLRFELTPRLSVLCALSRFCLSMRSGACAAAVGASHVGRAALGTNSAARRSEDRV